MATPAFVHLQVHVAHHHCHPTGRMEGLGLCREELGLERLFWSISSYRDEFRALEWMGSPRSMERRGMRKSQGHGDTPMRAESGQGSKEGAARRIGSLAQGSRGWGGGLRKTVRPPEVVIWALFGS